MTFGGSIERHETACVYKGDVFLPGSRLKSMNAILDEIKHHLADTDDPALWQAVLNVACNDISEELSESETKRDVFLVVGPCSSWLRPHQSRWRVGDLEFAWPSGYGGVAIPTGTKDRRKASINMYWTPGAPRNVRRSVVRFLALSRETAQWNVVGSHLDPGELWRGELLPPPNKRLNVSGGSRRI